MKVILFIIPNLEVGGAERVVCDLIKNIDNSKYKVFLALFSKQGAFLSYLNDGVDIFELKGCGAGFKRLVYTRRRILKLTNQIKPDIIFSHLVSANLAVLYSFIGITSRPTIIITEHSNRHIANKTNHKCFRRRISNLEIKLLYRLADKIITVSDGIKHSLICYYRIPERMIRTIHNPIDYWYAQSIMKRENYLSEGKLKSKNLIAIGRLIPSKGYLDLINAFSIIQKHIDSRLVIVGEGAHRHIIERKIKQMKLDSYIELLGFKNNPMIYLEKADVFISASYLEGFSLVILEAMACGVPPVVTDCDFGPREIVQDGVNGFLVPVGDIEKIAERVITLLTNEPLRNKLSENAKVRAMDFDVSKIVKQYEDVFDEVISKHNA